MNTESKSKAVSVVYVASEKGVTYIKGRGWVWVTGPDVKPSKAGARELEPWQFIEIATPTDPIMLGMADKAVVRALMPVLTKIA